MEENNRIPEAPEDPPITPETSVPEKPKRLKRHFFLAVMGIALGLDLLGQLHGELFLLPLYLLAPARDDGIRCRFMYLEFIGIDFLVLLFCFLCEKPIFRSFGWAKRGGMRGNTWKNFALGLGLGFAMNGLCILIAWLHGDLDFSVGSFELLYLLFALLAVCVQSGAEELMTRGYMMGALRERYGPWPAIVINSLYFGALHLLNPGITIMSFLQIVAIGFALSLVVYYLDSLWMCIAIHTAWNFTQNVLFGLPNSGIVSVRSFLHLEGATDSLFYSAAFGVEGGLTGVLVSMLLACAVMVIGKRKDRA